MKTHLVLMRNKEEIPVTREQFHNLEGMKEVEKSTKLVEIRDPLTGKQLFHGELGSIVGFRELPVRLPSGTRFWCWFGNYHRITDTCDCPSVYGVADISFQMAARKLYPEKKLTELTESQRGSIVQAIKNNEA